MKPKHEKHTKSLWMRRIVIYSEREGEDEKKVYFFDSSA
jgi:hypothetical protein